MGSHELGRVVLALGQVEELLRYGIRRLVLRPCVMEHTQPSEHRKPLLGLLHLLTQRRSPREDGFQLGRRLALGDEQRRDESYQEVQLVLVARRRLGHGGQHLQPRGEVLARFGIRRARDGALPGLVPVGQGLGLEARFRVVVSQQFGLRSRGLGKLRRQLLSNPLVILLPGALQQGLIGGFLDQRVFKQVDRVGRVAALIEQFRVHELPERPLEGVLIPGRHSPQQGIGKLPPKDRAKLSHSLAYTESIEPGHQRVMQRGRNRHWGQGTRQFIMPLALFD